MKMKIKNYTIEYQPELQKNTIWIDNGWSAQSVIFYEDGKWGADFPEAIPKYIKDILYTVKL